MKTIKQIADELNVDKQRVYRCVKRNNIKESYKNGIVMYYDTSAETLIKKIFCNSGVINEAQHETNQSVSNHVSVDAVIKIFQQELEAKNRQISELTAVLKNTTDSLKSAHALHAGTIQNQRRLTGFSIESIEISSPQENTQDKEPDKLRFVETLKQFLKNLFGSFRWAARAGQSRGH